MIQYNALPPKSSLAENRNARLGLGSRYDLIIIMESLETCMYIETILYKYLIYNSSTIRVMRKLACYKSQKCKTITHVPGVQINRWLCLRYLDSTVYYQNTFPVRGFRLCQGIMVCVITGLEHWMQIFSRRGS